MNKENIRVAIAIPTNRGIKPKTVKSLLELDCPYEKHIVMAIEGYTISENRIYIAMQALKNNCTHIFSVDDDQIFPSNTLVQMLSHGKEIVGCDIKSRTLPPQSHVETFEMQELSLQDRLLGKTNLPKEFFECKAIGTGVILIDTEVFKKIEKPWFSTETYDFGMTKMGEDYWFCRQARNAGYKIYCDPTINVGHIGDYIY